MPLPNESFAIVECPHGHRVRGDLGWLGRTVQCPRCQEEFVFKHTETDASDNSKWRPTDSGLMGILGEYVPPKPMPQNLVRRCSECGAAYPAEIHTCFNCNLELAPPSFQTRLQSNVEVEVDFHELDASDATRLSVSLAMRHRREIEFIDMNQPLRKIQNQVRNSMHLRYPVCDGSLDHVLGIAHLRDLLGAEWDVTRDRSKLDTTHEVQATTSIRDVMKQFESDESRLILVIDDKGDLVGMVTLKDLLTKISSVTA
jgi:CBS domain-containing protein